MICFKCCDSHVHTYNIRAKGSNIHPKLCDVCVIMFPCFLQVFFTVERKHGSVQWEVRHPREDWRVSEITHYVYTYTHSCIIHQATPPPKPVCIKPSLPFLRFTMVYSETPDMSDPSHDFVQQLQQGGTRGGGGGGGASQGGSNGMERGSASGTHDTRNGGGRNGSGYGIAGNRNGNNHNPPPLANGTGPSHYSPLNHSNPAPPSSFDSQTPHYPSHQHRGPPLRSEYQQQPQSKLEPPYEASSRSHRHYPRGANTEGRYHPYSRPSKEAGAGGGWR